MIAFIIHLQMNQISALNNLYGFKMPQNKPNQTLGVFVTKNKTKP